MDREQPDKRRQVENAIEQARFEAARAFRQYDAADPENRLVAADLERRRNERLVTLRTPEEELPTAAKPGLSTADRDRLMTLGKDLARAWDSPGVTIETRKKIVRMLIEEIIVDVTDSTITAIIHWHAGGRQRLRTAPMLGPIGRC